MNLEKQSVNLFDINPDWFYQKLAWNTISRLCNILTWEGMVKKGDDEVMAEHALSLCIAVPCSDQMCGPLFANTFLANIADYFVKHRFFERLFVNGDAIINQTDEVGDDGRPKEMPISFSFYRYVNGVSFIYFGFPNFSSNGGGLGLSSDQIKGFMSFSETLAISILQTAFVNGLFASIGGK